jgi:GNAT superfamily N-acetyltransferase
MQGGFEPVNEHHVDIISGYTPGSIGRVAELHGIYYHTHWGFGTFFEGKMAIELSELLRQFNPARDGFWTASVNGQIEGSIGIDGLHAEAGSVQLRWFIMSDALRGKGAGGRLIDEALDHCRASGLKRVYLWTFEGLHAARHLYEKNGFSLFNQRKGAQWGVEVNEQCFELQLV